MIWRFIKSIWVRLRGHISVNLIELGPRGLVLYPFSFSERRREIRIGKRQKVAAADLPFFASRIRQGNDRKFFIRLAADLALELHESFVYPLAPERALDAAEIDHLLSKTVLKFGDLGRAMAAERLGVPAVDIAFLNVSVWETLLDGRAVLNPDGCRGDKIEFRVSGFYTARRIARNYGFDGGIG